MEKPRFVALIPARAGSKRLPGKNTRPLNGIPLIAHSIRAAVVCDAISRVVVSTDSSEIQTLAIQEGCADHPLRPASLSTDTASSLEMVIYELGLLAKQESIDAIILLQPTSPLRTSEDIKSAIQLFLESGADTLTSLTRTHDLSKEFWTAGSMWITAHAADPNRPGGSEICYRENGAIYILSASVLKSGRFYGDRVIGYVMPANRSIDIDTQDDFDRAENYLAQARML